MAKNIVPAADQANTDTAVRWIASLLLVLLLGFAVNLLLDRVTTPAAPTSISSGVR